MKNAVDIYLSFYKGGIFSATSKLILVSVDLEKVTHFNKETVRAYNLIEILQLSPLLPTSNPAESFVL